MNDCAWCGTGEGICDDCASKMVAQSADLAAEGNHLVSTVFSSSESQSGHQENEEIARSGH